MIDVINTRRTADCGRRYQHIKALHLRGKRRHILYPLFPHAKILMCRILLSRQHSGPHISIHFLLQVLVELMMIIVRFYSGDRAIGSGQFPIGFRVVKGLGDSTSFAEPQNRLIINIQSFGRTMLPFTSRQGANPQTDNSPCEARKIICSVCIILIYFPPFPAIHNLKH